MMLKAIELKKWKIEPLGSVAIFLDGKRKPIKESDRKSIHGPYPYYGASGIIDYIDDYIFDDELILLGEDGANILTRTYPLAFRVSGKIWVNNHAHVIKPKNGININYLTYYLESLSYEKYNTGTAQPKLNLDICKRIDVLLPPSLEQEKIAEILGQWDRGIEVLEKLIGAKEKLKKGLMQQLLTGKKRFPEFKGEEWREYRIGEIFTQRVERGNEHLPLLAITGSDGVIDRDELERRDTSNADKSKYIRICPGDIGYNTMRMWQGVSGLSSVEGIISPAYTVCIPDKNYIDTLYISFLFKFHPIIFLFYRYSQGLVSDTWNLKFHHFSEIKVTLPSINEQKKIASVFNSADEEIDLLRKKLERLKDQKKGLMQKLLTGKIRVKV